MSRIASFIAVAVVAFAALAQAQLTIDNPSSSRWWVADSQNTLSWSCKTSPYTNWTVLITNQTPTTFNGPLALIAVQYNYDCSKTMIPGAELKAATGYVMNFANTLNSSDIWASSEPFEVKVVGSTYPAQETVSEIDASATGSANPSSTGTGSSSSSTQASNGAVTVRAAAALSVLGGLVALFVAA